MENDQFFKKECLKIFLPSDENLDNLVNAISDKFKSVKVENDKETILILERVEEDKK
jgi:hypothetical protein